MSTNNQPQALMREIHYFFSGFSRIINILTNSLDLKREKDPCEQPTFFGNKLSTGGGLCVEQFIFDIKKNDCRRNYNSWQYGRF